MRSENERERVIAAYRSWLENKLAKPTKVDGVVSEAEINARMRTAVQDLERYYHTYGHEADAVLAVVYAPSAAKPKGLQFTSTRLGREEERRLFEGKPCFKIVIRVDLGGK
jgi:hypothetical protein